MKRSGLELAKIISDFIFLGDGFPEQKAEVVFKAKHALTAHGFEKYIQYYFKKFGYRAFLNGNTYDYDGGIDIIGEKDKGNLHIEIIAQCKKYSIKDITEEQVRSFVGGVYVQDKKLLDSNSSILYYITTSKFTKRAQDYARKAGVYCVDFSDIYEMQEKYNVEEFLEDIRIHQVRKEYQKCVPKEQLQLICEIPESIKSYDVLQFLKQIRRDVTGGLENKKLYDIAKNETLEVLACPRPHNLEALKKSTGHLVYGERRKLSIYGTVFIDRLKYLHSKEKNKKY